MKSIDFCRDDELGYLRSRTAFVAGEGLRLDENYRVAHLPLVAPDHPHIIAVREKPGLAYAMGRHVRTYSLVLPIAHQDLTASPAFRDLEANLRAASFSRKIAWDLLPKRQDKLHATICGGLGETAVLSEGDLRALAAFGPVAVEVRGLFSGNINVGRLYLRVYPERREGQNAFKALQRALGRPETDIYVIGLYNLVDHLDAGEAAALAELIQLWWERPVLNFQANRLWLLGASDDLVLQASVADIIPLA